MVMIDGDTYRPVEEVAEEADAGGHDEVEVGAKVDRTPRHHWGGRGGGGGGHVHWFCCDQPLLSSFLLSYSLALLLSSYLLAVWLSCSLPSSLYYIYYLLRFKNCTLYSASLSMAPVMTSSS